MLNFNQQLQELQQTRLENVQTLQLKQSASLYLMKPGLLRARAWSKGTTVARQRMEAIRTLCDLPERPKKQSRNTIDRDRTMERQLERQVEKMSTSLPSHGSYGSSPRLSTSVGSYSNSFTRTSTLGNRRRRQQDPELQQPVSTPIEPMEPMEASSTEDSEEEAIRLALGSVPRRISQSTLERQTPSPSLRSRRQIQRQQQRQRIHSGRYGAEVDVDLHPMVRTSSFTSRSREVLESSSDESD